MPICPPSDHLADPIGPPSAKTRPRHPRASRSDSLPGGGPVPLARGPKVKMAWSTQNVWWRNSSTPGTFSGLFPRVRAYADPKPLPQAGGVRHRYTRTPTPRHSQGWLGGTLRAGPGPLIDPHGAHVGPGHTPPIPPLGHPTRHPALVIWLRKRRLAGHPKNVLKNAAPRFDLPAKTGVPYRLCLSLGLSPLLTTSCLLVACCASGGFPPGQGSGAGWRCRLGTPGNLG